MMAEMNKRVSGHKKKFDVEQILQRVPLLSALTGDERKKLAEGLHRKEFKSGDKIMSEGEEGNSFYIIVSGKVDVSTEKGGKLATLEDGDYAGEQALLQNTKRNATLIAAEDTVTLVCYQKLFKSILAQNTSIKFAKRDGKRAAFLTTLNDDIKLEEVKDKDDDVTEWLLKCVADNLLFANLDLNQRKRIVQRMELINVEKDQDIITQGDVHATTFYVVEEGSFDVFVDDVKVHQYQKGGCFGELALLYDSPRAATVRSTQKGKLWETDRKVFRYEVTIAAKKLVDQQLQFLKQIPLLKPLLSQELSILSDALEEKKYMKETVIFNEGDKGDKFYIIKEGTIKWSKKKNNEEGELKPMGVFGERALRTNEPRAATIEAKTDVVLLEMAANDFNELLGPIIDIIDDKINSYKRTSDQKEEDLEGEKRKKTITNDSQEKADKRKTKKICELKELKTIGILGKGGFGLVTLVVDPKTNLSYALKAIKKFQVIELELQKHIISEKKVMDMMDNRFLVNLHRTFKDKLRVYFLLDVCLGGELFTILRSRRYFNEPTARFYTACVVEAFDYMHSLDIIYRDLKPENLVLDSNGYLKVTDFGFAKICPDKTFTLCGTPDYLCPEIVTGQGHGKGVDWWTLGILIYEMLASFPPFVADDPIDTYKKIISGRIRFPRYFSQEVRELIRGLLHNKPTRRLGILKGGANNIRNHPWFDKFRWDWVQQGQMPAPIINKVKDTTDLSNFAEVEVEKEDAKPISKENEEYFNDF